MTNKEQRMVVCRMLIESSYAETINIISRLYDSGALDIDSYETVSDKTRLAALLVAAGMAEVADNLSAIVDKKELNNLRCFRWQEITRSQSDS